MALLETIYTLRFGDGRSREFRLVVDSATLELVQPETKEPPPWTALEFEQCRGCKLKPESSPRCPVAASMEPIVDAVEGSTSHDVVDVTVKSEGREITKRIALQEALKSIFGLLMVTSGCPAFERLKPMARFHLPFSSPEETIYRVAGMHMLGQYFRSRQGLPLDLEFAELNEMYAQIHRVNVDFAARLRRAAETDAHLNGVVDLDCLTTLVPLMIKRELPNLKSLFDSYLKKEDPA